MKPEMIPPQLSPSQNPEAARPQLRLIEGRGEDTGPDHARPNLYAVPDMPADAEVPAAAGETGETAETGRPAAETEPDREAPVPVTDIHVYRRRAAAGKSGALATRSTARRAAVSSETGTSTREDHHSRGGGGGWYIRELIRKRLGELDAKNHKNECVCEYCAA